MNIFAMIGINVRNQQPGIKKAAQGTAPKLL